MLQSFIFFNIEARPIRSVMFQDPATAIMEGIIDLHHYVFFYLFLVTFFVLSLILHVLYYFSLTKFTTNTRGHRG
jgi:heme/copper-type cytochrome/quinol oxidase subunit 2